LMSSPIELHEPNSNVVVVFKLSPLNLGRDAVIAV